MLQEAVAAVIKTALGDQLTDTQIEALAALFNVLPLLANNVFVHRIGEHSQHCFLVLEGEVTLLARQQFRLEGEQSRTAVMKFQQGSFFGESDFFLQVLY